MFEDMEPQRMANNVCASKNKNCNIYCDLLIPIRSQRLRFGPSAAFVAIYPLSSTHAVGRGLGKQTLRCLEPALTTFVFKVERYARRASVNYVLQFDWSARCMKLSRTKTAT